MQALNITGKRAPLPIRTKPQRPVSRASGSEQKVVKPAQQTVKPAQPTVKPTQPTVKPVQPTVKLAQPTVKQAQPTVKPAQPKGKSAQPTVKPAQQATKSAQPAVKSTQQSGKPEQKASQSETKAVKEDTKKQEAPVKKVVQSPLSAEKGRDGHYELNSLMTRMVDAELYDIMDKVYSALPNDPDTAADSLVVDIIKSDVWEDLTDVLGLNLTQRLLNVYNPLYVKVKFSGKPEKEDLREFLRKYNFTAFARKAVNIFAAQVKTIDDFDRICGDENVKCGSVKVIVSPVYSFTTCPPNLKTDYIDIAEDETMDTDIKEIDISEETDPPKTSGPPVKVTIEETKKENSEEKNNVAKRPAVNQNGQKDDSKKPITPQVNKTETKPTSQNANKNPTPSASTPKPATNATTAKTEAKVMPAKPDSNSAKTESKIVPSKTATVTPVKATPTKPDTAKVTATKPAPAKVTTTKPAPAKVTPTKLVPTIVTPTKVTKPGPKKTPNSTKSTPKKLNKEENDYDELDDEDILALMSEGIVLDECSGSEEE